MRVLLDEDVPYPFLGVMRHVLPQHKVDHVQSIQWKGKKDLNVLPDARSRGYQVLVTKDSQQLDDPAECDAIKKSMLHHVRFRQRRRGREGLALAMGAVIAAMPLVMDELEKCGSQRLVHIAGLDPGSRFSSLDPTTDPPRYWR